MNVKKRNGKYEPFDINKIRKAIQAAAESEGYSLRPCKECINEIEYFINNIDREEITVEEIQNEVEKCLMDLAPYRVAKAYILYRDRQKRSRFIRAKLDYMDNYVNSDTNAATLSNTDPNANVSQKNVANLEGEIYKDDNRIIQRQRMKDKLNELYPEVAKQYELDLNNHIIYTHDEGSTPVLKPYCMAVSLYPLMMEGVGNVDGVTPTPPNDIQSFSGQVTNLVFLLSSQCKGAVALGDYFVVLNYYVIKEFGDIWYEKIDQVVTNGYTEPHTISYYIRKGMKQFIYGVNQPAGNRSYNSPFTNVSYYDRNYYDSLFSGFAYPDGRKPEWRAIDTLQRMFVELHRELRLIKPLTFPVSSFALVHNGKDYLDKEYKELCAEEWAKGSSHFLYTSDNPASLASCCRVLNEMTDNTFSSTTGMTGIMTGSCNVITLNINRIVQNWYEEKWDGSFNKDSLKEYLVSVLNRVYKYHIAYKTMLYDMEDRKMFAPSNAGYIYIKKLYSTIGIIGYFEAAKFLGIDTTYNEQYVDFLKLICDTIKEQNRINSIRDKKRPFIFNSEAIPGENLGVKFYEWDKKDSYVVPEDQVLYNCYFYNPWDHTSILDKVRLHGKDVAPYLDGGQAAHLNLDAHLSKEQYLKMMDNFVAFGSNYVTFNIPMSECKKCTHVVNAPISECPVCNSSDIKYYTRIIGYLVAVDNWSETRQKEFNKRVYEVPEATSDI